MDYKLINEYKQQGLTLKEIMVKMDIPCNDHKDYDKFRKRVQRKTFKTKTSITSDPEYKPTWATVHYDSEGKIIQEWQRGGVKPEDKYKQDILEAIKNLNPYEFIMPFSNLVKPSKSLYVVPIYDMHLGVGMYENFIESQRLIAEEIEKGHEKVILAIGSDLIHNNDMKGNTANGTPIEQIDVTKAIFDAGKFYIPLIRLAIQSGAEVEVIYVKGNHDEMASWGFVHYLSGIFPQVKFDLEVEERKARLWNGVFVGFTHGDKTSNLRDMAEAFVKEFPIWGQATVREIYSGHLHKERVQEHIYTRVRILSTRAITDRWSKDRGFLSVKEFQTFVFTPNRRVRMVTV